MIRAKDKKLSVFDVAMDARCSPGKVYKAIKEGKLRSHNLFGKIVILATDYDRYCKVYGEAV